MQRFHYLLAFTLLASIVGCGEIQAPSSANIPTPPVPQPRQLAFKLDSIAAKTTSLQAHAQEAGTASSTTGTEEPKLLGEPLPDRIAAANGTEPLRLFGPTYAGKEFYWSDYRGRVVMVVFWASWCPGCKDFLPQLPGLEQFVRNRSFEIVTVNIDEDPADGRAFLKTVKLPFETIMDGQQNLDLSQEYPTTYVPTIVIVNKAGNITKLTLKDSDFMVKLKEMLAEPYAGQRPEIRNKEDGSSPANISTGEKGEEGLVEAGPGSGLKGRGYGEDPLTYALKARWTTEQKLIFDVQIPKALSLYQATNDHLPATHDEFMEKIIEENGLTLPELPAGDEYVYVPSTGKLMIRPGKK